ncbi:hypothetical protein BDV95DRAFT_651256 [Massariosphaeria phaeospora]|uniref:Uncharacterized protein n=1 Tax=Massariosphaeria phaeospora TaxID=100035 RepID=A0A7C8INV8_9PLEO|nr:hypothetical protein BDV95DRAFT_651256 [Massariosphaeria phaeospora]
MNRKAPTFTTPFTADQGRIQRDTRARNRVPAETNEPTLRRERPGPRRPIQVVNEVGRPASQTASISAYGSGSTSTHDDLYDSYEVAIGYYVDESAISPKTRAHISNSFPLMPNFEESHSPDIVAFDISDIRPIQEDRKGSDTTIFPSYPYEIKKTEPKQKQKKKKGTKVQLNKPITPIKAAHLPPKDIKKTQDNGHPGYDIVDFIRTAREIYHAGPKGEGQKLWSGVRNFRKENKTKKPETQQQQPQKLDNHQKTTIKPGILTDRPLPRLPAEADRLYDISPESNTFRGRKGKEKMKESHSSFEAPLGASRSVQYDAQDVVIDASKPLPPIPQLQPAPRSRNKSLPALPPPSPPPPPAATKRAIPPPSSIWSQEPVSSIPSPHFRAKMHHFPALDDRQSERPRRAKEEAAKRPGFFSRLGSKVPHEKRTTSASHKHIATKANEKRSKKQANFRPTISGPGPLMAPDGRTANIASEHGGVGGPAAAVPLPIYRRSSRSRKDAPQRPPRPAVGFTLPASKPEPKKEHSHYWRDLVSPPSGKIFGTYSSSKDAKGKSRKRNDSDVSFMCQGLPSPSQAQAHSPPPPPAPSTPYYKPHYHQAQSQWQSQPQVALHPKRAPPSAPAPAHVVAGPSKQAAPKRYNQRFAFEDDNVENEVVPRPLFSGTSSSNNWAGQQQQQHHARSASRDTRFYQPYDDVLREYHLGSDRI